MTEARKEGKGGAGQQRQQRQGGERRAATEAVAMHPCSSLETVPSGNHPPSTPRSQEEGQTDENHRPTDSMRCDRIGSDSQRWLVAIGRLQSSLLARDCICLIAHAAACTRVECALTVVRKGKESGRRKGREGAAGWATDRQRQAAAGIHISRCSIQHSTRARTCLTSLAYNTRSIRYPSQRTAAAEWRSVRVVEEIQKAKKKKRKKRE